MIILHHLNYSRSTRVLWMLEELNVGYIVERHHRTPGFAAPDSLKAIHPWGKAPLLEDRGEVIAESAVILSYLNDTYGQGRFAPAAGSFERLRHDQWLHWAEGSAAGPLMTTVYGGLAGGLQGVLKAITDAGIENALRCLAEGVGAGPYIMGEAFTIADVELAYIVELAAYLGRLEPYPVLGEYILRLKQRPAFVEALAMGDPMVPPKATVAQPSNPITASETLT